MWALPAAPLRLRIVPSTPTSGSELKNSGISGLAHACASSRARLAGAMRSSRDRPEPFSSTSSGMASVRLVSQSASARLARSGVPGWRAASLPSVRKSWRVITLLLYLLISRITSASGADSCSAMRRASAGTAASRALPLQRPPALSQSARKTAPKYCVWSSTLTCHTRSPQDSG